MGAQIITVDDLENFRLQLLQDIELVMQKSKPKKWLKTNEVMELLGLSEVTLQTLRNKGIIPYRKLGGICYYNVDELNDAIKNLPGNHS